MTIKIPPPPSPNSDFNDFSWKDWFRILRDQLVTTGIGAWSALNFSGSNITDIETRNHNDLQNAQGGAAGQKYHLTNAQYTGLTGGDYTTLHKHLNTQYYGSFYDTTDQHDGSTTIPYAMRLNSTALSNGVSVVARTVSSTASIATTTMTVTAIGSGRFYPAMLLSGTGVTSGTYVYLQLTSTAAAVATPTGSGGGSGVNTLTVSSATGIEERQFISGTNIPANTRIVSVVGTTVTLSANMTGAASGTYTVQPWGYQGTYSVSPSQTVASTTITGTSNSKITVDNAGIYNIQFSVQFANTASSEHDVDIWFKKNDVTIANSNSQYTIPSSHGGVDGHMIAALNFFIDLAAGDYVEIVWHTENSSVFIEEIPVQTSPLRPETPSVIVTVNSIYL